MIKADMKIIELNGITFVEINYLGIKANVGLLPDNTEIDGLGKSHLKAMYGKKKYRQIRDDVLNYVKQYMENKDDTQN